MSRSGIPSSLSEWDKKDLANIKNDKGKVKNSFREVKTWSKLKISNYYMYN